MPKTAALQPCKKHISGQKTPQAFLSQNIPNDLREGTRQFPPSPSWYMDLFHLPLGILELSEATPLSLCQETIMEESVLSSVKSTKVPSIGTMTWFHPTETSFEWQQEPLQGEAGGDGQRGQACNSVPSAPAPPVLPLHNLPQHPSQPSLLYEALPDRTRSGTNATLPAGLFSLFPPKAIWLDSNHLFYSLKGQVPNLGSQSGHWSGNTF